MDELTKPRFSIAGAIGGGSAIAIVTTIVTWLITVGMIPNRVSALEEWRVVHAADVSLELKEMNTKLSETRELVIALAAREGLKVGNRD